MPLGQSLSASRKHARPAFLDSTRTKSAAPKPTTANHAPPTRSSPTTKVPSRASTTTRATACPASRANSPTKAPGTASNAPSADSRAWRTTSSKPPRTRRSTKPNASSATAAFIKTKRRHHHQTMTAAAAAAAAAAAKFRPAKYAPAVSPRTKKNPPFATHACPAGRNACPGSGTAQNAWPDTLPGARRRKIAASAASDNTSTLMNLPSASRAAAAPWPSRLG